MSERLKIKNKKFSTSWRRFHQYDTLYRLINLKYNKEHNFLILIIFLSLWYPAILLSVSMPTIIFLCVLALAPCPCPLFLLYVNNCHLIITITINKFKLFISPPTGKVVPPPLSWHVKMQSIQPLYMQLSMRLALIKCVHKGSCHT